MSDSNATKKSRTPSITKLTERKKALEEELKATQKKLEEKQRAKAEKEKEKEKKDRTKALILLGLFSLESFKNSIQNLNAKEINNSVAKICTEIAYFYKDKNTLANEKAKKRLETEMKLLISFINKEMTKEKLLTIQAIPQLRDQNQPK